MTAEPRRAEADTEAAAALHRRTALGWMLEDKSRVRVSNPYGGAWTGRIVALSDAPAMLLEKDDGRRVMLPQCFAVEELPGTPREDEDPGDYRVPVGASDGNGVTFTRDDLLGALADSGFTLRADAGNPVTGERED